MGAGAHQFDEHAEQLAAAETSPRDGTSDVPMPFLRVRRSRPRPAVRPDALSEPDRKFLQNRLRLYFRTMGLTFLVLVLGTTAWLYKIFPELASENLYYFYWIGGAMTGLTLLAWLDLRRKTRSARWLRRIDVIMQILAGVSLGVCAYLLSDRPHNFWLAYIFSLFIVFGRALVIPSSGRRTLWVSVASAAPMVLMAISLTIFHTQRLGIAPAAMIGGGMVMPFVEVLLATVGSGVIYGLRAEVRDVQRLGQYTLGEKIGEGGMGTVYKAKHAMLRRPTALKILRPERANQLTLRRFEREVQLTSELTHPNTIAIYDYGRSPDGVFYYAMEYLDGVTLEDLVRRTGPLPAGRAIKFLRQICSALTEAHERGLIHRDIKPANVFVCQRGGIPDVAKVLDFGLVRELEPDSNLTSREIVAGTPHYMAPEAISDPANVAAPTDLYAVGGLAYYLVTGTPVFEGKTVAAVCGHHAHSSPVPPRKRIEDCDIASDFEELILRCLEKAAKDRFQTAREMVEVLDELEQADTWTDEDATRWWEQFVHARESGTFDSQTEEDIGTAPTMNVDFEDRF